MKGLTARQSKFVKVFAGNATEAARLAGYTGNDVTLAAVGFENLRKPHIRAAIDQRTKAEISPLVAARKERQEFWTEVMRSNKDEMAYRLQASALLGKSEGDFLERHQFEGAHIFVIDPYAKPAKKSKAVVEPKPEPQRPAAPAKLRAADGAVKAEPTAPTPSLHEEAAQIEEAVKSGRMTARAGVVLIEKLAAEMAKKEGR
jgi:phage terminase small subunit